MNQHTDSTFLQFPTASDPAENAASGGPKRGRPAGYAPKIIDMMCEQIRRFGLSDSAAAEQVGMSTSTVSRWKQLYPEIAPKLQQARQEIRIHHLEIIQKAAEAENGRGWRASAWILERLFPADYARNVSDRFAALNLEDRLKDREAHAALEVRLQELHAMQDAERAERAAAAQAAAAPEAEAPEAHAREEAEEAGAGLAGAGDEPAPLPDAGPPAAPRAETSAFHSEEGSHYSRNSEEAKWPAHAHRSPQAAEGPELAERATSATAQQAAAVQRGAAWESGSRNSQSGPKPPHPARPGSDGALLSRAEGINGALH
jgi:hypothetical protein